MGTARAGTTTFLFTFVGHTVVLNNNWMDGRRKREEGALELQACDNMDLEFSREMKVRVMHQGAIHRWVVSTVRMKAITRGKEAV